ncbi:hypothetical protein ACFO6R_09180 [Eubacterium multiforme]|uniref:Preprotein translocase subunit SecF n=1 Tax=Eubacterium multiforme TaxID=83339 RepID=A0ABT9UTC3_9FIRM|nr:hypothetical protein [Eubacterium multiforme]MDQ0149551.1 preprotein translocase subunit SecF [Eubacterium multiforme]
MKNKKIWITLIVLIAISTSIYFLVLNKNDKVLEGTKASVENNNSKNVVENKLKEKTEDNLKEKSSESSKNESNKVKSNKETEKSMEKKETENSKNKFTLDDAIKVCKEKYGVDNDTIYVGNNTMENVNGKKGYLIEVKSKELMKQGGTGVAFTVLVSSNKVISELK